MPGSVAAVQFAAIYATPTLPCPACDAASAVALPRYQKMSLWGWALGSGCTILAEGYAISHALVRRHEGESDEEYEKRVAAAKAEINAHLLPLIHAVFQVRACQGLLLVLLYAAGMYGTSAVTHLAAWHRLLITKADVSKSDRRVSADVRGC